MCDCKETDIKAKEIAREKARKRRALVSKHCSGTQTDEEPFDWGPFIKGGALLSLVLFTLIYRNLDAVKRYIYGPGCEETDPSKSCAGTTCLPKLSATSDTSKLPCVPKQPPCVPKPPPSDPPKKPCPKKKPPCPLPEPPPPIEVPKEPCVPKPPIDPPKLPCIPKPSVDSPKLPVDPPKPPCDPPLPKCLSPPPCDFPKHPSCDVPKSRCDPPKLLYVPDICQDILRKEACQVEKNSFCTLL